MALATNLYILFLAGVCKREVVLNGSAQVKNGCSHMLQPSGGRGYENKTFLEGEL